jgi:hypothetical protein
MMDHKDLTVTDIPYGEDEGFLNHLAQKRRRGLMETKKDDLWVYNGKDYKVDYVDAKTVGLRDINKDVLLKISLDDLIKNGTRVNLGRPLGSIRAGP